MIVLAVVEGTGLLVGAGVVVRFAVRLRDLTRRVEQLERRG